MGERGYRAREIPEGAAPALMPRPSDADAPGDSVSRKDSLMRALRIAALLGAGIAAVSVSVASARPWRRKAAGPAEDDTPRTSGSSPIWPPPPAAR